VQVLAKCAGTSIIGQILKIYTTKVSKQYYRSTSILLKNYRIATQSTNNKFPHTCQCLCVCECVCVCVCACVTQFRTKLYSTKPNVGWSGIWRWSAFKSYKRMPSLSMTYRAYIDWLQLSELFSTSKLQRVNHSLQCIYDLANKHNIISLLL
jgi:hypothetical protein